MSRPRAKIARGLDIFMRNVLRLFFQLLKRSGAAQNVILIWCHTAPPCEEGHTPSSLKPNFE